ncbi:MAG: 50S ribosomal protein L3 [Nanoarchaeota archaeon]|nr:50S ribosomal protein L3 [Nanoarchaeota archaeon]
MQFWPRKRSKREHARIRAWNDNKPEVNLCGFAGYKVGMTSVFYLNTKKTSPSYGENLSVPCTIIECPALKIYSARFYKKTNINNLRLAKECLNPKMDKEILRRVPKSKKTHKLPESVDEFAEIRLNVYTQPKLTGIGKKKPEIFEVVLSGKKEDQLTYIKEHLDKEINVHDVLKAGQLLDAHAITTGKGFAGAIKRFGIKRKFAKSEKSIRTPGSLGPWKAQQHIMYRVAHAGRMGYHTRTDYNKWLVKIETQPELEPVGHYGRVKNPYLLIKGSIPGPKKRLIKLITAVRPNKRKEVPAPTLK